MRSSPHKARTPYVDFTGWLDEKSLSDAARQEGVSARGVGIKFVVYPDGSFKAAMVSKLEMKADGTLLAYPSDDLTGILAKIYENKEL